MTILDWQTEEEAGWDDPPPPPPPPPRRPRRWPWLLLIMAAIALAAYLAVTRVQQRVTAAAANVEADVRAGDQLLYSALQAGDDELLRGRLSGRDAAWTDTQLVLAQERLALGDAARLFGLMPRPGARTIFTVTLSPELDEALVTVDQRYVLTTTNQLTQSVTLRQELIYRPGAAGWLLSPPADENAYWGTWYASSGRYLTVQYPGRDAAFAERLALDLDAQISVLCRRVTCAPDYHVLLRLERNHASLLRLSDPRFLLDGDNDISLPAPSLVGLPVDDASYQALSRAYAALVTQATIVRLTEWECCARVAFYRAFLAWELRALGLQPWPLVAASYIRLLDLPLDASQLEALWQADDPAGVTPTQQALAYALLEFLLGVPGESALPADLLASGSDIRGGASFWGWINSISDYDRRSAGALTADWAAYVFAQARARQTAAAQAPRPGLPDQDVLALCRDDRWRLLRYDPAGGAWDNLYTFSYDQATGVALPDDSGLMLLDFEDDLSRMRTVLWRPGESLVVADAASDPLVFPDWQGAGDPAGQMMTVWQVSRSERGGGQTSLLDLASCTPAGCSLQAMPGYPTWSPDGAYLLALDYDRLALSLGTRDGGDWTTVANQAVSPFWLDEQTYGYVQGADPRRANDLVLRRVADQSARTLVSASDLQAALPPERQGNGLVIVQAVPLPDRPEALLVLTAGRPFPAGSIFEITRPDPAVDWWASEITITWRSTSDDLSYGGGATVTPDGRWLDAYVLSGESRRQVFYNLAQDELALRSVVNERSLFQSVDYSADGQWLVRLHAGYLELLHPGRDEIYREAVFYDYDECTAVVWANRE